MGLMDKIMGQAEQLAKQGQQLAKQGQDKIDEAQAKRTADALYRDLGAWHYAMAVGRDAGQGPAEIARLTETLQAHEAQHGPLPRPGSGGGEQPGAQPGPAATAWTAGPGTPGQGTPGPATPGPSAPSTGGAEGGQPPAGGYTLDDL